MIRGWALVACAAMLGASANAQSAAPPAKPVFLVTQVVVDEGIDVDPVAARDALAVRFGRLKDNIEVRSLAEAKAGLDAAALAQLLGSDDDDGSALQAMEAYVDVDRVVFGHIAKVGGVVEVQVKVFRVQEGVTEVAFARRLKAGASSTMVLTLLDSLADALLAWTLQTLTEARPSVAARTLANKKLTPRTEIVDERPARTLPAWLGTVGAVGLGAGVGVVATGLIGVAARQGNFTIGDGTVLVIGGVMGVMGGVVVVVCALAAPED
jgi:hypothetical protein